MIQNENMIYGDSRQTVAECGKGLRRQSMSRNSDGKLFHAVGQETEKARPPSFVLILTVTADLV